MKKTTDIRERIAVRAYYAWLKGTSAMLAEAIWLEAEAIEIALSERRAAAAKKAANTRKAKAPAEMLMASKSRTSIRRPTAH